MKRKSIKLSLNCVYAFWMFPLCDEISVCRNSSSPKEKKDNWTSKEKNMFDRFSSLWERNRLLEYWNVFYSDFIYIISKFHFIVQVTFKRNGKRWLRCPCKTVHLFRGKNRYKLYSRRYIELTDSKKREWDVNEEDLFTVYFNDAKSFWTISKKISRRQEQNLMYRSSIEIK